MPRSATRRNRDSKTGQLYSSDCWGLKDRDLMGLPWRVAFALQVDGWLLRSKITWVKKAPMHLKKSPCNCDREVFLFSKTPNYDNKPSAPAESSNYWLLGPDSSSTPHQKNCHRRCILLESSRNLVLESRFSGSGTTGMVKGRTEAQCGAYRTERRIRVTLQNTIQCRRTTSLDAHLVIATVSRFVT